jgi:hypothetical protein
MNGDNNIGGPDHDPDHAGSGSGWTEHTPRATGDIDISVAYANPPTDELRRSTPPGRTAMMPT